MQTLPFGINGTTGTANLVVGAILSRDSSNNIVATLIIENSGNGAANNVQVTVCKLTNFATGNTISTLTTLPIVIDTVPANKSVTVPALFPGSAGKYEDKADLTVSGTYSKGTFSTSFIVFLP